MTEERITDWIITHLKEKSYAEGADLARQFCSEHKITRTSDPNFRKFMNVSLRLAGEIALMV